AWNPSPRNPKCSAGHARPKPRPGGAFFCLRHDAACARALQCSAHGPDRTQALGDRRRLYPGLEQRPRAATGKPRDLLHPQRRRQRGHGAHHRVLRRPRAGRPVHRHRGAAAYGPPALQRARGSGADPEGHSVRQRDRVGRADRGPAHAPGFAPGRERVDDHDRLRGGLSAMARVGYHASHEQFAPDALLRLVQRAEQAGFGAAMCSDHFHPWSSAQGNSGHAWTWLGAAMATTALPFGVVNAPGGRYHPAVIAQAAATLAVLHGERFWLAVGSGEALNECITGEPWPPQDRRKTRLREAAEVMRALGRGGEVSRFGEVVVDRARLYSLPATPPPLFAAALSPETARWAGGWADGLITVTQP